MTQLPHGWYPHQSQPGLEVYWDGARWTDGRKADQPGSGTASTPTSVDTVRPDSTYAWAIALLPLALVAIQYLAPSVGASTGLIVAAFVATVVLCFLDMQRLKHSGVEAPPDIAVLLVPLYLIARTVRAKSTPAIPLVWFVAFGFSILASFTFAAAYSFDDTVLENQIEQWFETNQGVTGASVNCPSDVTGRAGDTFDCTARDESGSVTVRVLIGDGGTYTWQVVQ